MSAIHPFLKENCRSSSVPIADPFYIATREISQGQYAFYLQKIGAESQASGNEQSTLPAVQVPFENAKQMSAWLGGQLPTEVEWEHAARGTELRIYPWGPDPPAADRCNLHFDDEAALLPVESLPAGATPEGLLHLLGNAAEWCSTTYDPGESEGTQTPGAKQWPVIRGGSFEEIPRPSTRLTMRANHSPEGAPDIGFRIVIPVQSHASAKQPSHVTSK